MSRFLNHLTNPEIVRTIGPTRLLDLLSPHQTYLAGRGLKLPAPSKAATLDHDKLIAILETPSMDTPQEMLNALGMINDMATEQGMDALLSSARSADVRLDLSDEDSPADVAVQVWLAAPALLEARHAWHTFKMPRRMECYAPAGDDTPLLKLTSERIESCRRNVADWMNQNNRSDNAKVLLREDADQVVTTIRRGDPYKRFETIDKRGIRRVHLRPAAKDVAILDRAENVLLVNSQLKNAREVYRRCMGSMLFGSPDHFVEFPRFTFDPFVELQRDVLSPADIDEIESIQLTEVRFDFDRDQHPYKVFGADDLVADMEQHHYELPWDERIQSMNLRFKFRNVRMRRAIKLYAGNAACYTRDGYAELIERWLRLRGIMLGRTPVSQVQKDDMSLAIA
ncbi:hypothetical protein [Crateriforma spongiae]|uniref:hypothetical protein n=1 Tax=Crateriforma spongiae TaxID=2724528 RepID=UPI00144731D0|nr:hypothetical protein [Crateriforma spongiae]